MQRHGYDIVIIFLKYKILNGYVLLIDSCYDPEKGHEL